MTATDVRTDRRLLAGWTDTGVEADLAAHVARYGTVAERARYALIAEVERSGLRGRGGAGFPTGRKLAAVAAGRGRRVVVANGCEGDPASGKDRALLRVAPHLVLDGIVLAAQAVGADTAYLCVHRGDPTVRSLRAAIAERRGDPVQPLLVEVPARYVASEESALVRFLNTGDARPTTKPPRPFERGVDGRPTLIDNVETLAHLALIARYGADWFRSVGTDVSPGTALVTVGGAVANPGVYEVAFGTPLGRIWGLAGGFTEPVSAALVGGYEGSWLPFPNASALPFSHEALHTAGAGLGVAALLALPASACGLTETAGILSYLAEESAGQCGPCMFGLPAVAADLSALARGSGSDAGHRLRRRLGLLPGRGACGHPDGATRLATSALRVFADDAQRHAKRRPCAAAHRQTVLRGGAR